MFCPPVCTFKDHRNAKTDNIREGVALSVECDQAPSEARTKLEALLGPATVVVESGGEWINPETGEIEPKVHLHWRLKKPASRAGGAGAAVRGARAGRQAGRRRPTNISIVHPIRWPGAGTARRRRSWRRSLRSRTTPRSISDEALERLRAAVGVIEPVRRQRGNGSGQPRGLRSSAVASALAAIPNGKRSQGAIDWDYWNKIGMTIWASTDGSEEGRLAFHEWSAKSPRGTIRPTTEALATLFQIASDQARLRLAGLPGSPARAGWRYENPEERRRSTAAFGEFIAQLLRERDEADDEQGVPVQAAAQAIQAAHRRRGSPPPRRGIRGARHRHRGSTMSLLPHVVREAAATSARVSGADIDAFAIGYLVGLAACGDTRLRITPKQHARDWSVPLLLWVLLVAPPSSMKSEVIKAARAMAASLDMQERERYRRDVAAAEIGATLACWRSE